jgi:Fe-S cluster assembly protein SufD
VSDRESALDHYRARFQSFAAEMAASDQAWMGRLRREAMASFAEHGFPTTRLEGWKYTDVAPIAKSAFELATPGRLEITPSAVEELAFPIFACGLFVFVNGRFEAGLSSPLALSGDLQVESLTSLRRKAPERIKPLLARQVDCKHHPFAALNTAFVDDGALVKIPASEQVENPIHLVFISTPGGGPTVSHPRVLVHVASGGKATLIQDHVSVGEAACLTNAVSEVWLEPNASLDLVVLQRENDATFHVANVQARQRRDSSLRCHTITLGGALVRNDLAALLGEEGGHCTLNGLYLGSGERLIDNHTLVDHAVPHCSSRELYKGVLGGRSKGVFRGRVIVRPDAQKTDAVQSNPNLLLTEGAEVDSRPQLEIHADDVKCSHGSTIGQLDPEALFYLRSRGIERAAARELLTQGFASEITSALPEASLGERVRELLLERLAANGASR